jgi:two-component sensor histidine kinase
LEINWTRTGGQLAFTWRERGGPHVSAPQRRGFGARMIDALARDLDGEARLDFQPAGLERTLTARLTSYRPGPEGERLHA